MIQLRDDTLESQDEKRPVDMDRQQIGFCLAIRGEGKSRLLEGVANDLFKAGYTGLDLHAPPNFENAFYCVPNLDPDGKITEIKNKKIRNELMQKAYKDFIKNPLYYCKKGKPISVTILCSESLVWSQDALDKYNDKIYTSDEFYKDNKEYPEKQFDFVYPQMKPKHKWGKELIRFVKLPPVTKVEDSETNIKAVKILTDAILDARVQRRMVILNRNAFGTEKQYFWTMELIMRSLLRCLWGLYKKSSLL